MKKEDLYYAFADLDEAQIVKAEDAVSAHPRRQTRLTTSKRRMILAAISLCVLAGFGCILGFRAKRSSLPFVLNAYAIDTDGATVTNEMTLQDDIPVSVFPYDQQNSAFVFSYPSTATDEKPHITTVYALSSRSDKADDISYLISTAETGVPTAGSIYIYYVFQEEWPTYEFTYRTVTFDENRSYDVNIRIYQKDGSYFAHLNSVTEAEVLTNQSE